MRAALECCAHDTQSTSVVEEGNGSMFQNPNWKCRTSGMQHAACEFAIGPVQIIPVMRVASCIYCSSTMQNDNGGQSSMHS